MNPRYDQHVSHKPTAEDPSPREGGLLVKPRGMSWRDYLVMLLQMGAELEHGLMVQYLFAAYSLNLSPETDSQRKWVKDWQDQILTVAREEMGHLLTVQNVLCFLGGPTTFQRRDFPWDTPFYPFPFQLHRLSRDVLALFVFAEMPDSMLRLVGNTHVSKSEIARVAHLMMGEDDDLPNDHHRHTRAERLIRHDLPHIQKVVGPLLDRQGKRPVGEIYQAILSILADPEKILDGDLHPESYGYQSSWDDWGRGYRPAPAAPGTDSPPAGSRKTNVLILRMATRKEAVDALREVMGQGEAPDLKAPGVGDPELSHFGRFVRIYQQFESGVTEAANEWKPVLEVASNPTVLSETANLPQGSHRITEPNSVRWAQLFNLRYRILLTYLTHSYRLARTTDPSQPSVRGAVLHKAFAEMYNLKAISGILVQLPLTAFGDSQRAGPPFEMPFSLTLPEGESECWHLYLDQLSCSLEISAELLAEYDRGAPMPAEGRDYLAGLRNLDLQHREWLLSLAGDSGNPAAEPPRPSATHRHPTSRP